MDYSAGACSYRDAQKFLLDRTGKLIADSTDAGDVVWCVRGNPQLLAQAAHQVMDSLGRNVDVFFTPYFNSDVFKGQHPGAVLDQKPKGVKLLGRQVDLLALNRDQPLLRANIEIPDLDGGRGSRSAGCRRPDSSKAREASRRSGLFCYVKAEIQEVTLLLRVQQI